jgi:hypothetical protein
MPITFIGGLMVVTATVDGQTGLFIIDTGNPVLILNTARVRPGPVVDSAIVTDALSRNVSVLVHEVAQFSWGDVTLRAVGAFGMDMAGIELQLRSYLKGQELFGMIGLAQLGQFLPVIDYANGVLDLYPRAAGAPDARVKLPKPSTTVPLTVTKTGLFIPGHAGDRSFISRLDSGDDGFGIDSTLAVALGAHVTSTGRTEGTLGIGGVVAQLPIVKLDQLMIGGVTMDNIEMRKNRMVSGPNDNGVHPEANLGAPFFRKYRLGFDMERQVMYLWESSPN